MVIKKLMSAKSSRSEHLGGSATMSRQDVTLGGKRIILVLLSVALLAAGCVKITLEKNAPSSPPESYQPIPK